VVVSCGYCPRITTGISASKTLCDNDLNSVDIPGGAPRQKALKLMAAPELFIVSDGVVPRRRDEIRRTVESSTHVTTGCLILC
jgi:hypothetical protein